MNAMEEAKAMLSEHDKERMRLDRIDKLVRRIEAVTQLLEQRAKLPQSLGMQVTIEVWGGHQRCQINIQQSEIVMRQALDLFLQTVSHDDTRELAAAVKEVARE